MKYLLELIIQNCRQYVSYVLIIIWIPIYGMNQTDKALYSNEGDYGPTQ